MLQGEGDQDQEYEEGDDDGEEEEEADEEDDDDIYEDMDDFNNEGQEGDDAGPEEEYHGVSKGVETDILLYLKFLWKLYFHFFKNCNMKIKLS